MKKSLFIIWWCLMLVFISCDKTGKYMHPYRSDSETALYYYQLGWQQIMDEGRYAAAERSYRKTIYLDPNFLIGQSVYARVILDTDERIKLYNHIEAEKSTVGGDERILLDVYQSLVHFTNLRDQKSSSAPDALKTALILAEKSLGYLIVKYPDEIYLKAEYIEILHSNYGAKQALDSLEKITDNKQKNNPFLLGYAASLEAELGNFESALQMAKKLAIFFKGIKIPKPEVVFSDIYFKQNDLGKASYHIEKAYRLDKRNLDTSRLRKKINEAIEKNQSHILRKESY